MIDTITQYEYPCCQFYLGGRTAYTYREITNEDRDAVHKHCIENNKTFYIHCPLISNLANTERDDVPLKTRATVLGEMTQIRDLPGACVVHIGKRGTIEQLVTRLNDMKISRGTSPRMPQQLLLESAAGQGTELGWTWDQLRHIYEGIDISTIGLCMDTQHAFAAGMSDFLNHESVCKFYDNVTSICSNKSTTEGSLLRMIHLNDSLKEYESRVDRHESLGQGYIWSSSNSLKSLLLQSADRHIDLISETPTPSLDVQMVKSLNLEE
jgi:deoxyribonuclease-4